MGKAKNKNRSLSKTDKVYAKKARNKLKKQNVKRTGQAQHLLAKLAETNKNRIVGLKSTESRRSFRKRLAKFSAERLAARKGGKGGDAASDAAVGGEGGSGGGSAKGAPRDPTTALGPRNSSFSSLVSEFEALQRRIEAGVPTHAKKFTNMLKLCAAIGEYHLAVYVLGQLAAQELEPTDEAFAYLRLLQQKTPTNQTYIKGVELGDALNGLHPKVVIKQLLQKRQVDSKWEELQPQVTRVRHWLASNTEEINAGRCPNRFKLASLVASKCELSNKQAREVVAGLHKAGYVREARVQRPGEAIAKKIWVVKGVNSAFEAARGGNQEQATGKTKKEHKKSKPTPKQQQDEVGQDESGLEAAPKNSGQKSGKADKKKARKKATPREVQDEATEAVDSKNEQPQATKKKKKKKATKKKSEGPADDAAPKKKKTPMKQKKSER